MTTKLNGETYLYAELELVVLPPHCIQDKRARHVGGDVLDLLNEIEDQPVFDSRGIHRPSLDHTLGFIDERTGLGGVGNGQDRVGDGQD